MVQTNKVAPSNEGLVNSIQYYQLIEKIIDEEIYQRLQSNMSSSTKSPSIILACYCEDGIVNQ